LTAPTLLSAGQGPLLPGGGGRLTAPTLLSAGQGPLLPGGGGRLTAPTLLAMGLQYMLESDTVMGKAVIPR